MNILIAFDCAAINVARIRNERQKSTLPGLDDIRISRLRSAYKWACNRYRPVDDTMSKASPPSPPPSRTKRRVNLRGLARTGRTRNFCLDVCPVSLYYTRISSGAFESPLEKRNVRRIIIFERRDRYFHRLAYIQINKLVVFNIYKIYVAANIEFRKTSTIRRG